MNSNRKTVQLILIAFGIFLILITYFMYPKINEKKIAKEKLDEEEIAVSKEETNSFQYVEYKGLFDADKVFIVKSDKAYILTDEPDIVYMAKMEVTLYLKNRRIVVITSDEGSYNKLNYDCFFRKNVRAIDGETIILAENLDLLSTKDYAAAYTNVDLTNNNGSLKADKLEYDFENKRYKISMFDNSKIKAKLIQ